MRINYSQDGDLMLKKREKKVLIELLKNGRKPDKHIAKDIGTTQTTVTRIRQKLERDEYVENYRARANLKKVGLSIIITTVFEWTDQTKQDIFNEAKKYILAHESVVFFGRGEGMSGKTAIIITVHKNYHDYDDFMKGLRRKWDMYIRDLEYFTTAIDGIYKRFCTKDAVIHTLKEGE